MPHYTARVIQESPPGRRPVDAAAAFKSGNPPHNNIVDITRLCHVGIRTAYYAFDYDLLAANEIIVRRAAAGETLVTLDGTTRKLDEEALIIADRADPLAWPG